MSNEKYMDLIDASRISNAIQDDTEKLVESRYAAVIASAKRAREIIDGAAPVLENTAGKKPLTIAIEELARQCITVKKGQDTDEPVKSYSRRVLDFSGEEDLQENEANETNETEEIISSEDDYNSDSEA